MVERMYEYFDSNWSESHRVNDSDTHMLTLTCCSLCNQKYNLTWGLQQLREVWTKDFKSSPDEEDDVQEDDVEMTGEGSGEESRVDEDPFEKQMRLTNEVKTYSSHL